ncbi:MAG: hypoxanthine phosphoribosyltransferase [Bacteroidales bacterium]|nr:hypoxanthine phosphoribosyltransferase [Bacteroidales bacterium]
MAKVRVLDKEFETSIPESAIQDAVRAVAEKINRDLEGKDPLFVCILNGAFMFAADLMKCVSIPCEISFVKVASYAGTSTTGKVKELIGFNENLDGRTVVLVEDIVDTGITIDMLRKQVSAKGAADVRVATMLYKPDSFRMDIKPEYIGLNIPNDFIVGHGLDYNGYGRNLKDIYTLIQ